LTIHVATSEKDYDEVLCGGADPFASTCSKGRLLTVKHCGNEILALTD
jgi:hypothetical protein